MVNFQCIIFISSRGTETFDTSQALWDNWIARCQPEDRASRIQTYNNLRATEALLMSRYNVTASQARDACLPFGTPTNTLLELDDRPGLRNLMFDLGNILTLQLKEGQLWHRNVLTVSTPTGFQVFTCGWQAHPTLNPALLHTHEAERES